MADKELKEIFEKYGKRLEKGSDKESGQTTPINAFSQEYTTFRKEALSEQQSRYEWWCNFSEQVVKFAPPEKEKRDIAKAIETIHMNMTPSGAASFAALVGFLLILIGFGIGIVGFLLTNDLMKIPLFWPLLFLIAGLVALKVVTRVPLYMAARWRLRASNQMVLCILYVVIYMRHTSNLENAIKFSSEHVGAPLSLDLQKIFWDIETRKFSTIKESLDHYLESWRHYNMEFITSFHLIESSLYEPTESRRLDLLDKALNVILEGTYEKMLHYAQDLKNPITTLHMLGVILPILGLVIFPLVGSFLGGLVQWYHLAFLYNLILPVLVFAYGMNVLGKRPTGYGEARQVKQAGVNKTVLLWGAYMIVLFFTVMGLFPVIIHIASPGTDIDLGSFGKLLNYQEGASGQTVGPFGLGALIVSFCIPSGLALGFAFYYKKQAEKMMKLRNQTRALEKEFSSALFQLGNRIADGVPTEMAFSTVAQTLESTPAGKFFGLVDRNIRSLGMGLREAIFNEQNGAVLSYPSPLIESSMRVLVESAQKGPQIVARSLMTISNYVDEINKVNERLQDILSEVVSSMKAQISFLTPAIAGIVVGISAMIVGIIVHLNEQFATLAASGGEEALGTGGLSGIINIFGIEGIIPGYFFQIVVGIYVVELVFILSLLQNGIENGPDKVNGQYLIGKNMIGGVFLYVAIALVVSVLFFFLAKGILAGQSF